MLQGGWLVNCPHEEIAEPFARQPIAGESGEQFREDLDYALLADILGENPVEALAMKAAAEPEIVLARRPASQRDLGDIGPRAAVGTSAHANRDRLLGETVLIEDSFDLRKKVGQVPLRFGHRQRTGRKG